MRGSNNVVYSHLSRFDQFSRWMAGGWVRLARWALFVQRAGGFYWAGVDNGSVLMQFGRRLVLA